MNWTEKYRPRHMYEVVGNEEAKKKIVEWMFKWRNSDKYGILLIGPPGIGKTTFVYALANDLGYHVIELNASDYRTEEKIMERVGFIAYGSTLETFFTGRRKRIMIFFDEVDGIDPKEDRGGLKAIIKIASKKAVPVVASANFIDQVKHKELIDVFEVVEFKRLTPKQIIIILGNIAKKEGLRVSRDDLVEIAKRSYGDARMAINMLYTLSIGGEYLALSNPLENLPLDQLLRRLSSTTNLTEIKYLLDNNSGHWEDVIYTYFDIVSRSKVMKADRREYLLEHLSILDIMLGRMKRERTYFYLRYISSILAWVIYQANKWGAVYDGRIPEYRLYTFVLNKDVREEFDDLMDRLRGRLHESRRKFIYGTVSTASLIYDSYPNLRKWVERIYGGGS